MVDILIYNVYNVYKSSGRFRRISKGLIRMDTAGGGGGLKAGVNYKARTSGDHTINLLV
jgi:hypothetical protein